MENRGCRYPVYAILEVDMPIKKEMSLIRKADIVKEVFLQSCLETTGTSSLFSVHELQSQFVFDLNSVPIQFHIVDENSSHALDSDG